MMCGLSYIFISLVEYLYSNITSALVIINEVPKLLYHCTNVPITLPSLSMPPLPTSSSGSVSHYLVRSPFCAT